MSPTLVRMLNYEIELAEAIGRLPVFSANGCPEEQQRFPLSLR